jgi:hypothetical protein
MHVPRPNTMYLLGSSAAFAVLASLCAAVGARAQDPVVPRTPATVDSFARSAADSVATSIEPAPGDSLASATAAPDSATAGERSLATASSPVAAARIVPSRPRLGAVALRDLRPETLEDVIEWMPGATVRVAGDFGMPAYVGLSPVGSTAPELWLDGIPTRSPADLDPGIWDRSAIALDRVGDWSSGSAAAPGDPGLWMHSHDPEPGRVLARTRFSSTDRESYHRGISATTPASGRALRVDFEEWKTESGIAYSGAPGVISRSDAGRSKMRRFRLGTDFDTEAGRLRMFFGRGRRYYRGSVLSARDRERWTGEIALALDHGRAGSDWTARAWHLDFSDDDRIVLQELESSRTGVALERRPRGGGWLASLLAERWAARFAPDDTTVVGPVTALVLHGRAGWTADPEGDVVPWAVAHAAHADHVDDLDVGGRAGADLRVRGIVFSAQVERLLRVPTLAETHGRFGFDTIEPLDDSFSYSGRTWSWRPDASLRLERQERAGVRARVERPRWQLEAGVDRWRLREGVGWRPDPSTGSDVAQVSGDGELDVTTSVAIARWNWVAAAWALRGAAHGQRVLGTLEPDLGRGGGWPEWNVRTRVLLDRRFFSVHNRLGLEIDVAGLGPRHDDAVAAFSDLRLPTRWRLDARVRLMIRDAVIGVGFDNLLDTDQDEVLGTFRRGRQLRWQLDWTFYN